MGSFALKSTKSTGDGNWEMPDAGSQPAVLVAIIDLGTHKERFEDKKTGKTNESRPRKIFLLWELTEAPMSGTKGNFLIGQKYTLSLNENAGLTKMLKGWGIVIPEGQEFDIESKLGEACMVTINHKPSKDGTKTYAEFGGVASLYKTMKGKTTPAKIKPFIWSIPEDYQTALAAIKKLENMAWLPRIYGETVTDVIMHSEEWGDLKSAQPAPSATQEHNEQGDEGNSAESDSIPF